MGGSQPEAVLAWPWTTNAKAYLKQKGTWAMTPVEDAKWRPRIQTQKHTHTHTHTQNSNKTKQNNNKRHKPPTLQYKCCFCIFYLIR
jgi:hypothetical protein